MTPARSAEDRLPAAEEHRLLAEAVRWHDSFDGDTLTDSLAGSILGVVAVSDARAVGMARVVWDG